MNAIIFSKDRAMQLECLLRSIGDNCDHFAAINVLYREEHRMAYDILMGMYPDIHFHRERNFKEDFLYLLPEDERVALFCDDDIVFQEVPILDLMDKLGACDIVSLRLGNNIYTEKHFDVKQSIDGNIFRSETLKMLSHRSFTNPNQLETQLRQYTKSMSMGYFETSRLIGIPANRVSDTSHCEEMGIDTDGLNELFLTGYIIDYRSMNLKHNNVHLKIPYKFKSYADFL